jgi:guanylate kinase
MHKEGILFVIDGASATGKTTIVGNLISQNTLPLKLVKRYVTRRKRDFEDIEYGYNFISNLEFDEYAKNNLFLEHKCYKFGMCYGILENEIKNELRKGTNLLTMINLGNFKLIKQKLPLSFGVFLNASLSTIEKRLKARGSHTQEQIEERLHNALEGRKYVNDYDLVLNNEEISIDEISQLIIHSFQNHLKYL